MAKGSRPSRGPSESREQSVDRGIARCDVALLFGGRDIFGESRVYFLESVLYFAETRCSEFRGIANRIFYREALTVACAATGSSRSCEIFVAVPRGFLGSG